MGSPTISKAEWRKRRRKRIARMTAFVFVILFVITLCVSFFFSGAADASSGESLPIFTYDEQTETENITEGTEPTENMTEPKIESSEPTVEETTEPTEEAKNYTEDDLFYLAAAVCREAGGESEEIQLLVANVIINRVNSSLYPDTIYEVLTQYKQYGTMWKYGVSFPDWADENVKEQCYSVAQRILDGERYCPENVLFQAEFQQGSGVYKHIGVYYFCYYD